MNDPEHVKKAKGFDPLTGGREKPLSGKKKKAIYPNKERNKEYVKRALGFEPLSGARPIQQPYEDYSSEKNRGLDDLENPSIGLITELIRVAKTDASVPPNLDIDKATQVIVDILKACFFFKVTDLNQIAYIFATIAHESRFGMFPFEEGDKYYISQYEPVFGTGQINSEKKGGFLYKKLTDGNDILSSLIAILTMLPQKKETITETQLSAVNKKILAYLDDYKLNPNDQFLATLKRLHEKDKLVLMEICEKFLALVLDGLDDQFTREYLEMKDLVFFSRKMGIGKNDATARVNNLLTDEQRRKYRIEFFPKIVQKLLDRIIKSDALGNIERGDGERFKGHGLVQLTRKDNFEKYSKLIVDKEGRYYEALSSMGVHPTQDDEDDQSDEDKASTILAERPELLAENIPIAAVIAVGGMAKDGFTSESKTLRKYTRGADFEFFKARDIVNVDKQNEFENTGIKIGEKIEKTARAFVTVLQPRQAK